MAYSRNGGKLKRSKLEPKENHAVHAEVPKEKEVGNQRIVRETFCFLELPMVAQEELFREILKFWQGI